MTEVLLLFGPTGVGKTAVVSDILPALIPPAPNGPPNPVPPAKGTTVREAGAPPVSGRPPGFEVVNADSIQVYKHLEIGSARPDAAVRRRIPHHLVAYKDPSEQFHVGEFVDAADRLIHQITARGRRVVVSGGTAFYLRTLMFGLPGTPAGDPAIRRRLEEESATAGIEALQQRLARVDPDSAKRIQPSDSYRIIRALEVYEQTGRPLSSFSPPSEPRSDVKFAPIYLYRPREELYKRIEARVDEMFRRGLPNEIRGLLCMGYSESDPGLAGIGYREFFRVYRELYGKPLQTPQKETVPAQLPDTSPTVLGDLPDWPQEFLETVKARIKRNTRRFAKRQATFFAQIPNAVRTSPEEVASLPLWPLWRY